MAGGPGSPDPAAGFDLPSADELAARERERRPHGRRPRHREHGEAPAQARGAGAPSAEEVAYREARRLANRKIGFLFHFVPYAFTVLFLLLAAGFRAALIVALAWGIGVACHAFAVVAPSLRKRMIDAEVQRRLQGTMREERRSLAHEHVRELEQLSASIAHEIRNPITAAKSLVQQLEEDPASPENVEYARVALDELDRVERSISHLLRYAREEELQAIETNLQEIVEGALETLRERAARLGVAIECEWSRPVTLRADAEKLRRVVINLVGNALDALEEAKPGAPQIRITAGENLAGTDVWLRVRDNGPGMDAVTRDRAFRPFHTSKSGGTGLGLPIVRKLVEAHGGTIELHSAVGVGSEFVVVLPRRGPDTASPSRGEG